MKKPLLLTTTIAILLTGCVPSTLQQSNLNASGEQKSLRFTTNESTFIAKLKPNISKDGRNEFIDEFILKSDVQCQQYLNNPEKDKKKNKNEDELYMNIAHTVSTVLGL
ncbi:hypothetical protein GSY74_08730, partial [Sulfurovum sp. bin170]|uniref:hypothetical protein n=1 Tax=Sulfurovum sp. bin170 TaxID=2695268 RepID=UPI0013DF0581